MKSETIYRLIYFLVVMWVSWPLCRCVVRRRESKGHDIRSKSAAELKGSAARNQVYFKWIQQERCEEAVPPPRHTHTHTRTHRYIDMHTHIHVHITPSHSFHFIPPVLILRPGASEMTPRCSPLSPGCLSWLACVFGWVCVCVFMPQ